jgi:hypothetical protein
MRGKFLIALIGLLTLSGCTSILPSQQITEPQVHLSPLALGPSPVATPSAQVPERRNEIPTPNPSLASIAGSIVMQGHPPGTFPADLYLGDPTGSNPIGAYIALDTQSAPKGYVKADGTFVFPNVPSGTYAILVWTPVGAYAVPDPATGTVWLIEIKGDAHIDAGQIVVPPVDAP